MVLKPAVTRLAATPIAPEPALFRRERCAGVGNRAKRLKTDLSYPLSFPYLRVGATKMPGQPFRDPRSSLPSTIGDVPPTADLGVTGPIRTVIRCLSSRAVRHPVTAAGQGRVAAVIRSLHLPVCFVRSRFKSELRRLCRDLPVHLIKRLFFAAIAVLASKGSVFVGRQKAICVPVQGQRHYPPRHRSGDKIRSLLCGLAYFHPSVRCLC